MRGVIISKFTRQDVYEAFREAKGARLKERYHCVLLAYDGCSLEEIAATLGRDYTTIRGWIQLFNRRGIEQVNKPRASVNRAIP